MMLVAVIALSGSTFAWFAINNQVTATGMEVKTQVSNNLFIAPITSNAAVIADTAFTTTDKSEVEGLLEPVSTVDGKNFFYTLTDNVKADGDAKADAYVAYDATAVATDTSNYANAFSENYQVNKTVAPTGAVGYVDHVFALKAVNTTDEKSYINMDTLILSYLAKTVPTSKAFRVAVLTEKGENSATGATFSTTPSPTTLSLVGITDSEEFDDGNAVAAAGSSAPTAISTDILDKAIAIEVQANSTEYYRVTVRLWLEGEDTTCNNTTFADLNKGWTLDMRLTMTTPTGGVTAITQMAKQTTTEESPKTYWFDGTNYYDEIGGIALTDTTAAAAAFATE